MTSHHVNAWLAPAEHSTGFLMSKPPRGPFVGALVKLAT
jgi:hypothetical protein